MTKKLWDVFAPIYERAMRADRKTYDFMYERIRTVIRGKEVLEIATGPGLLAKHVAHEAARMVASDYSEGMIAQAKKGARPDNLSFEVADATALPYDENSFDAVIIANALHIMPGPERALREIDRVLKKDGVLIAPNFVRKDTGAESKIWAYILKLFGVKFEHQWTPAEYLCYLSTHGWRVCFNRELSARVTLMYAECARAEEKAAAEQFS